MQQASRMRLSCRSNLEI